MIGLAIAAAILLIAIEFEMISYVYCQTIAYCDPWRPTRSPEAAATVAAQQYEYALKDIAAGRYQTAQVRLQYLMHQDPPYPGASEKLREVQALLSATGTP